MIALMQQQMMGVGLEAGGGGGALGAQAPPSSPDTKKYSGKNIKKPQK